MGHRKKPMDGLGSHTSRIHMLIGDSFLDVQQAESLTA
jgi:hypothetical protein